MAKRGHVQRPCPPHRRPSRRVTRPALRHKLLIRVPPQRIKLRRQRRLMPHRQVPRRAATNTPEPVPPIDPQPPLLRDPLPRPMLRQRVPGRDPRRVTAVLLAPPRMRVHRSDDPHAAPADRRRHQRDLSTVGSSSPPHTAIRAARLYAIPSGAARGTERSSSNRCAFSSSSAASRTHVIRVTASAFMAWARHRPATRANPDGPREARSRLDIHTRTQTTRRRPPSF